MTVFLLCGLWHGANWTFVVWGAIQGAFSLLEEVVPLRRLPRVLGHAYLLLVTVLSFVVFRSDGLAQAGTVYAAMFTRFGAAPDQLVPLVGQLTPAFLLALVFGAVTCMPLRTAVSARAEGTRLVDVLEALSHAGALVVLVLSILSLASGAYNPFIYFRF